MSTATIPSQDAHEGLRNQSTIDKTSSSSPLSPSALGGAGGNFFENSTMTKTQVMLWAQENPKEFVNIVSSLRLGDDVGDIVAVASQQSFAASANKFLETVTTRTNSHSAVFYVVNEEKDELNPVAVVNSELPSVSSVQIGSGRIGTAAAQNTVIESGIPSKKEPAMKAMNENVRRVQCTPVAVDGEVFGVLELFLTDKSSSDGSFVASHVKAAGPLLKNSHLHEQAVYKYQTSKVLLDLAQHLFEKLDSLEDVVEKIIASAARLVPCERCSVFMVDKTTHELYSTVFDLTPEGKVDKEGEKHEIRFGMSQGISGHVATTGETLNIVDAYKCDMFNADVDKKTGFKTKSILCMPIFNAKKEIVGVAQMVNAPRGFFTKEEEARFRAFGIFCGLGIDAVKLHEETHRNYLRAKVVTEVLSYHSSASEEEALAVLPANTSLPSVDDLKLYDFNFNPLSVVGDKTITSIISMLKDLCLVDHFRIPTNTLCRFLCSVRRNYRPVTYHNWRHAYSVTQSMYCMIKQAKLHKHLSMTEQLALMVGSVCHDLDHRGTNNTFQKQTSQLLAQLYSSSTMEHHHFDQSVFILNSDGNNFLSNLSVENYKQFMNLMEHTILSTDLALYFKRRDKYFSAVKESNINLKDDDDRALFRAMVMTGADLSAVTRPWEVQSRIAEVVYAEFYEQGDLERVHGLEPAALTDRTKILELPKQQTGFIDFICKPLYTSLAAQFTELKPMEENLLSNRAHWEELQGKYKGFQYVNENKACSQAEQSAKPAEQQDKSSSSSCQQQEEDTAARQSRRLPQPNTEASSARLASRQMLRRLSEQLEQTARLNPALLHQHRLLQQLSEELDNGEEDESKGNVSQACTIL